MCRSPPPRHSFAADSAAPAPLPAATQQRDGVGAAAARLSAVLERVRSLGDGIRREDLQIGACIGRGTGGSVYRAVHAATGAQLAVKMVRIGADAAQQRRILMELEVLLNCRAGLPNIVQFCPSPDPPASRMPARVVGLMRARVRAPDGGYFWDGAIALCMEYMDGGSLAQVSGRRGAIPEPLVGHMAVGIVRGLVQLYERWRIVHRDVKPSNVLVDRRGSVKLCDFGVSGQLENSVARSFVGTNVYMAVGDAVARGGRRESSTDARLRRGSRSGSWAAPIRSARTPGASA